MGCIYVAVSAAGVIKVGATTAPDSRLPALKTAFRKFGDELKSIEFCDEIPNFTGAENSVIYKLEKVAKPYYGREWFEGIAYEDVLKLAKDTTHEMRNWRGYKPLSKKAAEKARAEAEAERLRREEERRVYLAQCEALRVARLEARVLRTAQIAEVAARKLAAKLAKSAITARAHAPQAETTEASATPESA